MSAAAGRGLNISLFRGGSSGRSIGLRAYSSGIIISFTHRQGHRRHPLLIIYEGVMSEASSIFYSDSPWLRPVRYNCDISMTTS